MYKCVCCGRSLSIDVKTAKKIICPSCGYRILEKERPKVVKKIPAE